MVETDVRGHGSKQRDGWKGWSNKMDFTLSAYKQLISTLQFQGYFFQTFEEYIKNSKEKVAILRHDVDRKPENALVIAKIEKEGGIKSSYYFRVVKESYDEDVIRQIAGMGHEIGYHYENLSEISRKSEVGGRRSISHRRTQTHTDVLAERLARIKMVIASRKKSRKKSSLREKTEIRGQMSEVRRARARDRDPHPGGIAFGFHGAGISQIDADERQEEVRDEFFELALDDFRLNLEKLRKLYPVKTICMHGSPLSKWDNRDLWKRYDYRDFGIIAEPYFDLNFNEVFYLTDTGRSWNNSKASVRDKVNSKFDITIKDTHHLIDKIQNNELPDKIMINVHPQRWFDYGYNWYKELLMQNFKNVVKRLMLKLRD